MIPRRLHSRQTASSGSCGRRPTVRAVSSSSSWPRVDGAAAQLGVDRHVVRDRRRGRERLDVLGMRVDRGADRVVVGPVAQRLDAAGRGARADRHEQRRLAPDADDLLDLLRGADRALDEDDVDTARRSGGRTPRRTRRARTAPSSSSRWSSRSSSVSWQPSQDAILTIPRRGRGASAARAAPVITDPPVRSAGPSSASEKTGPSRQTNTVPELAVAAQARRRIPCGARASRRSARRSIAAVAQHVDRGLDHPLGPADEGRRPCAVPAGAVEQPVTTPTRPNHSGPARSTVWSTSRSRRASRRRELVDEQPVARRPRAVDQA